MGDRRRESLIAVKLASREFRAELLRNLIATSLPQREGSSWTGVQGFGCVTQEPVAAQLGSRTGVCKGEHGSVMQLRARTGRGCEQAGSGVLRSIHNGWPFAY